MLMSGEPFRLADYRICHVDARTFASQAAAHDAQDGRFDAAVRYVRLLAPACDSILLPAACFSPEGGSLLPGTNRNGLSGAPASVLEQLSQACAGQGIALLLDLVLAELPGHGPAPEAVRHAEAGRLPPARIEAWGSHLLQWAEAGVAGVRCCRPLEIAAPEWQRLIALVHARRPGFSFLAWTPGMTPQQLSALEPAGFSATFLSLPWWDGRASWLLEEYARLSRVAPVIAPVDDPDIGLAGSLPASAALPVNRLWMAAFFGDGILLTAHSAKSVDPASWEAVRRWLSHPQDAEWQAGAADPGRPGWTRIHRLAGPLAPVSAFTRQKGASASMLVINPDQDAGLALDWSMLAGRLPGDYVFQDDARASFPSMLPPGGLFMVEVFHAKRVDSRAHAAALVDIAIENIRPSVDQGLFAAKACVGDQVDVRASIFAHGHGRLAASLLWRAGDDSPWQCAPMREIGNDEWEAGFQPLRLGAHAYKVRAWRDEWSSFCEHLRKKLQAGQDLDLEVEEGRQMLAQARSGMHASDTDAAGCIDRFLKSAAPGQPQAAEQLLSAELAHAMHLSDQRLFETDSIIFPLTVDRRQARYANWYELFPRSQAKVAGRHGTLCDVIERLPAIAAMGFDVLYFPPIHPIGQTNRKGRNNALKAAAGDPGSPYAIGAASGGHDAIHPELGGFDEFQALVQAARRHNMDIALDFAIQCSPDHPWLKQHPDWFEWRPDGSLRYAENPPKRYEDIVNPSFHDAQGRPRQPLWDALLDIILFWVDRGVAIFRVDNPHTKPLLFWEWLIAQVKTRHPQVIFLSEAFTRPAMMYRLAKAGFSQSYTYFTWRNTKQELTDYLIELSSPPAADFFRPNFFVNTPDINPWFLQNGGRAGFLIRAALATTLSGLWGMYSGFELCEAAGLPGKEEYLDAEKYELRHRDGKQPGNIVPEITRLNQLRRDNPALQSHLGVHFHEIDNAQILFYTKSTHNADNVVIVAVSLDPRGWQSGTLDLPLWQWGLPDDSVLRLQDLFEGRHFQLKGRHHRIDLSPDRPFVIWGLLPS